jgi:hypothetical protein
MILLSNCGLTLFSLIDIFLGFGRGESISKRCNSTVSSNMAKRLVVLFEKNNSENSLHANTRQMSRAWC